MKDIIIVGGGLAGLINALQLARAGLDVLLIERKAYPFHKVCGEYVSNEVVPFLQSAGAYPEELDPVPIRHFMLSSCSGRYSTTSLDMGGFGISRYAFDQFLYERAKAAGALCRLETQVQNITYCNGAFRLLLPQGEQLEARLVIGAYGKRARLDRQLDRDFIHQHSPYIGVKYHIKADFPDDYIALHNFKGGYCGISRIENGRYNLCYLGSRASLRKYGNIQAMEKAVLYQNPFLKHIFTHAEFLFEKPEVINEISFAPKAPVENHILMSGDTAGLITPLCGNGMAMAIHSAKILSDLIIRYYHPHKFDRDMLEREYTRQWRQMFASRLWIGRHTQKLFGSQYTSEIGVQLLKSFPILARKIMSFTHGKTVSSPDLARPG